MREAFQGDDAGGASNDDATVHARSRSRRSNIPWPVRGRHGGPLPLTAPDGIRRAPAVTPLVPLPKESYVTSRNPGRPVPRK